VGGARELFESRFLQSASDRWQTLNSKFDFDFFWHVEISTAKNAESEEKKLSWR
jgi:hypothetical protein